MLASVKQGFQLQRDATALGIPINPKGDGTLILASDKALKLGTDLEFTVAGPMQPELLKLQEEHDKWLQELKDKGIDPEDALAAFVDRSVPNLSSIVTLVKAGGKTMLLTGDARGDKILKGFESIGLLAAGGKMHVDLLKVPHHGSANNLTRGFFERITAQHYVFSGNGEHGNPERDAVAMLLDARGTSAFEIHLTYPIDEIDVARKKDWEIEQAKERTRKANGTSTKEPRPDWSAPLNSLKAFFEQRPLAANQRLHIVQVTNPHVIDLLDPLGF